LKFLADGMLGGLTRWLRLLGENVIYSTQLCDNELLELAKVEDRILLTQDLELYKRAIKRGMYAFYVEGKTESSRLCEVSKRYGLTLEVEMDKSRCPICNTLLKQVNKEMLKDKLKPKTYTHYDQFWRCPPCGQIYWQGAHWKHIMATLTEAKKGNGLTTSSGDMSRQSNKNTTPF
jgi:uncharacterized protein with PIN domain